MFRLPATNDWRGPCASRSLLAVLIAAVWVGAVSAGFYAVAKYEFQTEAHADHYRATWPEETSLVLSHDRPTLLLFLHPKCPCSRASLSELERLLGGGTLHGSELPTVWVVATVPAGEGIEWAEGDTLARGRLLPKTQVFIDQDGYEAERFGAVVSGTVCVFAPDGSLLYGGGVTASRGHEGAGLGTDLLRRALRQRVPAQTNAPSFGCRLCLPTMPTSDTDDVEHDPMQEAT